MVDLGSADYREGYQAGFDDAFAQLQGVIAAYTKRKGCPPKEIKWWAAFWKFVCRSTI